MKKNTLIRYLGPIILCSGLWACSGSPWEPLFNGENLNGWTVNCLPADRKDVYWSVEEGCIVCNSMGNPEHNYVWLTSDRKFSDFRLRLKFQVYRGSRGNSGVQFRSSYDASAAAPNGGWMNGPQVDIHGPSPFRTGLIYDETQGVQRWIHPSLPDWRIEPAQVPETALSTRLVYYEDDPDTWNSLELECEGMQITTWINGNRVSSYNGEGVLNDEIHRDRQSGEEGCFAFQLHMNDELKIRFKDIQIKELVK